MLSDKFICATNEYSSFDKFIASPLLRKSFVLDLMPAKSLVTIGAAGFYELFINGQRITKGLLAPYISNPDHIVYYDEYDITEYLCIGENILGIQLGNGMQNAPGGEIWDFHKASFRGSPRVAFSVETINEDGSESIIEADSTVKTAPSAVVFDDLRCGCFYDAREEKEGWLFAGFDDSLWGNALPAESPRGEKMICRAEPIVSTRHLKPIGIRKCEMVPFRAEKRMQKKVSDFPSKERVGYLYDFGIDSAGIIRLKIRGKRGQKIDLQFGEYLDENGNPDISNVQFYPDGFAQRDIYICKGEGEEIFEPRFTYHGFRYVVVLGITEEQATKDLLTYIVCNSALEERGNFRCSDETINRLQAMTRNATLSNFYYFPTDCPHREKNGWTGDASMSARHMLLNLNPEKSFKEWLRNICRAQRADGMIPGVVPTAAWGYGKGFGPAWDAVIVNLPYMTYIFRGDKEILEENADAIFRYMHFLDMSRTSRGTVDSGLGDWCPVTTLKAPVELTNTIMAMDNARKASYIFGVLGLEKQKTFCDSLYCELRGAVRKYLVDFGSMTAKGRCQTAQSMAIFYNVFDESEKPKAFEVLLEIIKENDYHIDFGFIGFLSVFRVLCDFKKADIAFKMIARSDYPSFGCWVKRGYTALAENFHPDGEFPDSLNHHCFGDISAIFIEYFAGIRVNPYEENCREVNISPCFIEALDEAAAFHETVEGRVSVKWSRSGNEIKLSVKKPENIFGEIMLPDGFVFADSFFTYRAFKDGEYRVIPSAYKDENIIEV